MAIFHLSAKIVKRSDGRTAVAAAAYRSGSRLYEESTGLVHDYTRKEGVAYTEILAPAGAPAWMADRTALWNAVEAAERRKDAQVAREIEVGLPVELTRAEQIRLVRDYVQQEFVACGMVADIAVHLDNPLNPHAHILLTTRSLEGNGFGRKARGWNTTAMLKGWRQSWSEVTNEHLVEAGLGVRIDHRSYRDQGLALTPGRKLGLGKERRDTARLPGYLADRVAEQQAIAGANGAAILRDPTLALTALSYGQATFTHPDLARWLNTRTRDAEQFQAAWAKVTTHPELVALGVDDRGARRFSTRTMLKLEAQVFERAEALAARTRHAVPAATLERASKALSAEQRAAVSALGQGADLALLVGVAGAGKSTTLAALRAAWGEAGYRVRGAALAGIAAENLQRASGIEARTLASFEHAWRQGRERLTARDVLVVDEAGQLGTRALEGVLTEAQAAGAKVVLIGDPAQLQAIEAGAPFRGLVARRPFADLSEVRRQHDAWQRAATENLAQGEIGTALAAYRRQGRVVAVRGDTEARRALLARWAADARESPGGSQLALAYRHEEVLALNQSIRQWREERGELGTALNVSTARGARTFAVGDRLRFLRNERDLAVKNGSLGTVTAIESGRLSVRLEGREAPVVVDPKFYPFLEWGYAATVHSAQGVTVDRTYVLGSRGFDRHMTYVALSRHRAATTLVVDGAAMGIGEAASGQEVEPRLAAVFGRARSQSLAHDFLSAQTEMSERSAEPTAPTPPSRYREYQARVAAGASPTAARDAALGRETRERPRQRTRERSRDAGLEHD